MVCSRALFGGTNTFTDHATHPSPAAARSSLITDAGALLHQTPPLLLPHPGPELAFNRRLRIVGSRSSIDRTFSNELKKGSGKNKPNLASLEILRPAPA